MFEHHKTPLVPTTVFLRRMLRHAGFAVVILVVSLGGGVWGYMYFEGLPWVDALLNASMLLGGMGEVDPLRTTGGKLFASAYALFSGTVFLIAVGVMFAPVFHRFMHRFHLAAEEYDDEHRS